MSITKFVALDLTPQQLTALAPLFEHARSEAIAGRLGIILAQPFGQDYESSDAGKLRFGFVESGRAQIVMGVVALKLKS